MNLEKITTIFNEEQIITALLISANDDQMVKLMEDEELAIAYMGIVIERVEKFHGSYSMTPRPQYLERIAKETTSNAVLDAMVEELLKRTDVKYEWTKYCKVFGEILTNKNSSIKTIMKTLDLRNYHGDYVVANYFFKNYTMDTKKLIEIKKFTELCYYSFAPKSIGHGCCEALTKGRYSSQLIEYAFENFYLADLEEQRDLICKCKERYLERVMQILAERYDGMDDGMDVLDDWFLKEYEKRTGKAYK